VSKGSHYIYDLLDSTNTTQNNTTRHICSHPKPSTSEPILIIDSAADISCVGQGFHILFYTGETTTLGIAFVGQTAPRQYDIVCAATVIHDIKTQKNLLLIINQAAYIPEPSQVESLLHADQARHHHVIANDIAECYFDSYGKPGRQSLEVDNDIISLNYDGLKYFLHIHPPTE
jgi:hypothetical protein